MFIADAAVVVVVSTVIVVVTISVVVAVFVSARMNVTREEIRYEHGADVRFYRSHEEFGACLAMGGWNLSSHRSYVSKTPMELSITSFIPN